MVDENVKDINFITGHASDFSKKFFNNKESNEFLDVIVIVSKLNDKWRYHMIPLGPVFKIF